MQNNTPTLDDFAEFLRLFQVHCQTTLNNTEKQLLASVTEQKQILTHTVQKEIYENLKQSLQEHQQQIEQTNLQLVQQATEVRNQLGEITAANKKLLFKAQILAVVALILSCLALTGITIYYKKIIKKYKQEAELTQIINASDIYKCGNNLCASISKEKRGKYHIIKKRNAQ